jgi:hypothetical protein
MSKKLLAIALAAGPLLWASGASAVPIAAGSELSLNGSDMFAATSVTFTNPANIGGETGSFLALANCTACATMTSFSTTSTTPFQLYTATEGAITTTLQATTDSFAFVPSPTLPSLTVTGTGTLTLTGFDPTPGSYILTTQGPGGAGVTFSVTSLASAVATPEPTSLALLGTALFGLGWLGRRRRRFGAA